MPRQLVRQSLGDGASLAKAAPSPSNPRPSPLGNGSHAKPKSPNQKPETSRQTSLAKGAPHQNPKPAAEPPPNIPTSPIPRSEFRPPRSPDNSKPEIRNPKLNLESAIAVRLKSKNELSDLVKLLAEKSARQAALETTGDLHNAAVLADIGRLQIFTALLPRRIAAQEQAELKAEQTLTDATNQFVREHLGPRVRQLATRTRAIVEADLSSHFPDPAALILAVAGSERVRHIEALAWPASIVPAHGALEHAQGALKSWSAADKFENELANSDSGGARIPSSRAS